MGAQALHASSVSHRSLAPSRVLVTSDFRLKINGAGVAPVLHASLGQASGGAPNYLAPEGVSALACCDSGTCHRLLRCSQTQ